MGSQAGKHTIEVRPDVVIKQYRSLAYGEPEREWRALELLNEYEPGLAPAPVTADLDADPPTVVMSRLGGAAVRGPIKGHTTSGSLILNTPASAIAHSSSPWS
ncbi:hypothetical protein [Thermoactinospora rubra]|uniref:hypothetical protein n=1 Tax=Thermoactinospora rubra TaxID=1088767 RepID=UPI00117EBBA3|nr:hypothetical protein [Thermoactinospora rubra]